MLKHTHTILQFFHFEPMAYVLPFSHFAHPVLLVESVNLCQATIKFPPVEWLAGFTGLSQDLLLMPHTLARRQTSKVRLS